MNKIERLTAEILLLQDKKRGSEELAGLLEVSKRTVIRDIQALCEIGVPVISKDGLGGGYELAGEYTISPLQLTWREALLLMIALDGLSKHKDAPFSKERTSLLAKVRSLIPEKHRERVEEMLSKVEMEVPEREQRSELLDELMEIVEANGWMKIRYRSAEGGENEFVLKPQRVFADHGFWYLEAKFKGQRRVYRTDRILEVQACDAPEEQHAEALPYDHFSHPTVRVRLTPRGASFVEREPHIGRLIKNPGEPVTLEFRCPPAELDWYSRYFSGMGRDAIVESPSELIVKIIARADNLLKIYSSN